MTWPEIHGTLRALTGRIGDSIRADIGGASAPKRIQRDHLALTAALAERVEALEAELQALRYGEPS